MRGNAATPRKRRTKKRRIGNLPFVRIFFIMEEEESGCIVVSKVRRKVRG